MLFEQGAIHVEPTQYNLNRVDVETDKEPPHAEVETNKEPASWRRTSLGLFGHSRHRCLDRGDDITAVTLIHDRS